MKSARIGFSLMELLVTILIVSILAAAITPILRGKVDLSKWTEANSAAGMLRNAATSYYAEYGTKLLGAMNQEDVLNALDIKEADLNGTFFKAGDYSIVDYTADGVAIVTVTASLPNAPSGSRTLNPDGSFE